MPAVTAAEFALHNLRFQQQPVKLLQKLFILERVALWLRLRNRRKAELAGHHLQSVPVNSGKNIAYEVGLEIALLQFEFGVAEVKRERCGRRLAGLYRAR